MTTAQELTLNRLPSLPPLLLKAAVSRRKPTQTPIFPLNTLRAEGISIDADSVNKYASVCGFDTAAGILPPSYLHVLAFRLQMKMMTQADFPVPAMGAIHLKNRIRQLRELKLGENLNLTCQVADHELTDRGIEFGFLCQASDASGEVVWEDYSRYLSRMKMPNRKKSAPAPRPEPRQYANSEAVSISRQTARQYAKASGDFNPIHLHDLTAKVLGFKKMIAHGMWSKAFCMAKLQHQLGLESFECEVEFKTPVFLPARAELLSEQDGDTVVFELRDQRGKPHLIGQLGPNATL